MRTQAIAAIFALAAASTVQVLPAAASSLEQLHSACRTGDYAACSAYNTAIIKQNSAQTPVLQRGFDPFAIVPAGHTERVPKAPASNTGKPGMVSVDLEVVK
jgi:hypothetical protein